MAEPGALQHYLELAEEVRSLTSNIVNEVSPKFQVANQALPLRDRMLIGLALKMYGSLECLVKDAKTRRSEAMHHLKTMVETFIYFHWVGQDTKDTRARLVFAAGCHRKTVFF